MWESEFLIFLCITGEETKPKEEEWCWTNLKVAVVAGVTAVAAIPVLLSGAGFTTVGVAAGSVAAFVPVILLRTLMSRNEPNPEFGYLI